MQEGTRDGMAMAIKNMADDISELKQSHTKAQERDDQTHREIIDRLSSIETTLAHMSSYDKRIGMLEQLVATLQGKAETTRNIIYVGFVGLAALGTMLAIFFR